ncbi:ATP-dependent Clp protease ATP-binding subunit [Wolffia australiana]
MIGCGAIAAGGSAVGGLGRGGDQRRRRRPAAAAAATGRGYSVDFKTMGGCKLGISWYPEFDYDATGGAAMAMAEEEGKELAVEFEAASMYIPALASGTTRFLGLPLPPFLKIEIAPEKLQGIINTHTGQVDLDFRAKFWFSVGRLYQAPALVVETKLTTEESVGKAMAGRGRRLDEGGVCSLVGVATVTPVNDLLLDNFLRLPTECIARLNAFISVSTTQLDENEV